MLRGQEAWDNFDWRRVRKLTSADGTIFWPNSLRLSLFPDAPVSQMLGSMGPAGECEAPAQCCDRNLQRRASAAALEGSIARRLENCITLSTCLLLARFRIFRAQGGEFVCNRQIDELIEGFSVGEFRRSFIVFADQTQ